MIDTQEIGRRLFHVEQLPEGGLAQFTPRGCIRVWDERCATITKEQEALWQEMADLTLAKCKEHCRSLGSCCSGEYCDMAAGLMEKAGVKLPPMPFAVDGKCVIPPHFRPLCSLHQCKISGLGFDLNDPEWTKRYFELREKLEAGFEV